MGEPRGEPQPETGANVDADVHAFLIGDIRGWTSFTQEHGDEVAARLAARFAEVAREVVEDHRGRVVELRGDEVMAVFGSPRSAIRAAVALQHRFVEEATADPSLPLTVGIGLDAGEAVAVEGGYRGGALNVAGRLQARAKAGEILASREIVHLARRIDGIRFTERGPLELKGLDQPVHVIAVASEDQDAAVVMAPFVRTSPPSPTLRKRWEVVAAVAAFALVVGLVAIPLARNGGDSSEIAPNSIGILDPDSGDVVSTLGLEARPGSFAVSADGVWVTNPDVGTVTRIDPTAQSVVDSIQVGENPTSIAVGEDVVWVVESGGPSVSRISPGTNTVVGDPIQVGNGPAAVAVGGGAVWVTNQFDGTISRIDPNRGEVVEEIPVGLDPQGIAVGFGSVWVTLAGSNTVLRIDPLSNEVTHSILVGNAPGSLAVGADGVWVVNALDDTVSRIDPDTNSVVPTVPVGMSPSGIAIVGGVVWVANEADGTLSRIEPGQASREASVRTSVTGSVPQALADVGGDLWVSVRGTSTSHQGGTLRLASEQRPLSIDSAVAYDEVSARLMHLLGDGLVTIEPVGGTNPRLVPDLALSKPTPTDDGKTYTFQLRSGIRYSNGEVVMAGDFRRSIERLFDLQSDGVPLFSGLVGSETCADEPGGCDLRQGIVTDDATGTIVFHLADPDPEFLYKLTLPFAYPVPPSTPDEHQARAGVPGTGPYMLDGSMTDEGLALVRNPRFRVWSQAAQPNGYVDRIEWAFGVEPNELVEAVASGEIDLAFEVASSDRLDEDIFVSLASQTHTSPAAGTYWISLDTSAPPFDDIDVRRAINFAVDRDRVVELFGGERAASPTCQQLPPNFPGYEPYCPYTEDPGPAGLWSASRIGQAQRIIRSSDTLGMRIDFEYPPDIFPQGARVGRYFVELLEELGFSVRVASVPYDESVAPGHDLQEMTLGGWGADYPAASNFFAPMLADDFFLELCTFCDRQLNTAIDRAVRLESVDPAATGALWARVDRAMVDLAPFVWLVNPISVELTSKRVNNYQSSPAYGVLLNQLWVR